MTTGKVLRKEGKCVECGSPSAHKKECSQRPATSSNGTSKSDATNRRAMLRSFSKATGLKNGDGGEWLNDNGFAYPIVAIAPTQENISKESAAVASGFVKVAVAPDS